MAASSLSLPSTPVRRLEDRLAAQRFILEHLCASGATPSLPAPTPQQWSCVFEEAARYRLGPVTYRRLVDGPWAEAAPADVRERLRALYVRNAFRNAILLREAAQAVESLAQAGIPTMLLKGVYLAGFLYEEPALRSMADIDIMVPRARLAEAERIFLARGYGPVPRPDLEAFCTWSNHLAALEKPDAEAIEVHYDIERPTSPFRIDTEALWARARTVRVNGVQAWALSDEDLLLHLCMHASYHHRFDRAALKGLLDVATLLSRRGQSLDWNRVVTTANEWGAGSFVYCTLMLAGSILRAEVPPRAMTELVHEPLDDQMTVVAARYILTPQVELPAGVLEITRQKSMLERLSMLLKNVFLPREQLRQMYRLTPGSWLVYPFYIVRLIDLIARRGGIMLRIALHNRRVQPTLDREEDRREIERWVNRMSAGTAAS
jgi:hypothetical protein